MTPKSIQSSRPAARTAAAYEVNKSVWVAMACGVDPCGPIHAGHVRSTARPAVQVVRARQVFAKGRHVLEKHHRSYLQSHEMDLAYLHDELNWSNEVAEKLEKQVLLLLLHLIETISGAFVSIGRHNWQIRRGWHPRMPMRCQLCMHVCNLLATAGGDLLLGKTHSRVGLQPVTESACDELVHRGFDGDEDVSSPRSLTCPLGRRVHRGHRVPKRKRVSGLFNMCMIVDKLSRALVYCCSNHVGWKHTSSSSSASWPS
jgi:hypothetical protein